MSINDGGPAFPMSSTDWHPGQPGMSLRDYFAIHADIARIDFASMNHVAEFIGEAPPDDDDFPALLTLGMKVASRLRYMYADAMLAERERSTKTFSKEEQK